MAEDRTFDRVLALIPAVLSTVFFALLFFEERSTNLAVTTLQAQVAANHADDRAKAPGGAARAHRPAKAQKGRKAGAKARPTSGAGPRSREGRPARTKAP